MDAQHEEAIEGVVDEILRETSRIDVLVNNAGLMSIGLAEATPKRKRRMSWMLTSWDLFEYAGRFCRTSARNAPAC
jgi:NADP-dependent 3-hydroxy acid dehydrogenase YdfG